MAMRAVSVVLTLAILAYLVLRSSLFAVGEAEMAIRTQFGKVVGVGYAPGLHLKWPLDDIVKIDRRLLSQSYSGETLLTHDNRALIVDYYVSWRVQDAPTYFRVSGAHEEAAGARIGEIVKDGLKSVVAQRTLSELIGSERATVSSPVLAQAGPQVAPLGVQLVDVRVQRIDLPEEVAGGVYDSMKESFARLASRRRAEGQSQAAAIRAAADRERSEILASAQADALRTRGEADAEAARIAAQAYSRNPEFYAFYRSLQAYKSTLGKAGDLLVLTPDGEFFKYLKSPQGARPPPPPPAAR